MRYAFPMASMVVLYTVALIIGNTCTWAFDKLAVIQSTLFGGKQLPGLTRFLIENSRMLGHLLLVPWVYCALWLVTRPRLLDPVEFLLGYVLLFTIDLFLLTGLVVAACIPFVTLLSGMEIKPITWVELVFRTAFWSGLASVLIAGGFRFLKRTKPAEQKDRSK